MTWIFVGALVLAVFGVSAFILKAPRNGWEAICAALLLGVAGYAAQGSPGVPGAPKEPIEKISGNPEALIAAREKLGASAGVGNSWLVIGDALARHGQYADAASVFLGAVEKDPKNAEGWLALANSLVQHADGTLSPAAFYAYQRAAAAAPDHPGPPFFLGMALAQSGRLMEARALWADLLARSPKDAPWRSDLADRLSRLDAFIAAKGGANPQ